MSRSLAPSKVRLDSIHDSDAVREPGVPRQMNRLGERTKELMAALDELEKRLTPMLRDRETARVDDKVTEDRGSFPPLVRDLFTEVYQVELAISFIKDLQDRLEI